MLTKTLSFIAFLLAFGSLSIKAQTTFTVFEYTPVSQNVPYWPNTLQRDTINTANEPSFVAQSNAAQAYQQCLENLFSSLRVSDDKMMITVSGLDRWQNCNCHTVVTQYYVQAMKGAENAYEFITP